MRARFGLQDLNPEVNKRVQQLASERMTRTAKMALAADADQWV